ncbi:hypothetical protein JW835_04795 [bacterium]|nr:hypothetical protein [bacterium]
MKTRPKGYSLWLGLTIILTLAGIGTLIPEASASKACMIGYKAHCTFTPISTLICFFAAGMICRIRNRKFTKPQ